MPDLPERLAWSHLVIARAGASTIAELTAAGSPTILIQLPSATDDHQSYNAREMARRGGARMLAQSAFHTVELAKQLHKLGLEQQALGTPGERPRDRGGTDASRAPRTGTSRGGTD